MHKPDAATPSVQRIMDAIAGCEASADELREMIFAALAEARHEGAMAMREAAAVACGETYTIPVPHGDVIVEVERPCYPAGMTAGNICAIPLPTGPRQAVLQWQPVPQTLPPDPLGGWFSPYVWLAFEDGTVERGKCLHKPANAAYSDPVQSWYVDDQQVDDDRNVVAWMLFAVPDHPGTIPSLAADGIEVLRG